MESYNKVSFKYAMDKLEKEEHENLYVQIGGTLQPVSKLKVGYTEIPHVKFFLHKLPSEMTIGEIDARNIKVDERTGTFISKDEYGRLYPKSHSVDE